MLLKIVCLLTRRVLGLAVLAFRGDRAKMPSCSYSSTRTRCCAGISACGVPELGHGPDLGFYAARSYSLMRPPRTGRRWMRSWERSATGWSGRGGWS